MSLDDKISGQITEQYRVDNLDKDHLEGVVSEFNGDLEVKNKLVKKSIWIPAVYRENEFVALKSPKESRDISISDIAYLTIETLSSYNSYQDKPVKLKKNEILLGTNIADFDYAKGVKYDDKELKIETLDRFKTESKMEVTRDSAGQRMGICCLMATEFLFGVLKMFGTR